MWTLSTEHREQLSTRNWSQQMNTRSYEIRLLDMSQLMLYIQFKQRDKIQVNILPCASRFYCSCIQISSCFHASITCVLSMNLLWHSIWQRNMAKRYSKCRKVFTLFESWAGDINCSCWIWRKLSIELNTAIYQFDQIRFHGTGERREEILWSHYFSNLLSALLLEFNHKCAGIVAYVVDFLVSMVVSWMILWW